MDGKIVFRFVAALVLIAAMAGVAFFAFNAGVATHLQVPPIGNGQASYPYLGYSFWHPFPFLGLGCFAPLIALFLLILAFRAINLILWGPSWGYPRHMHRSHWRNGWDENAVPPMFQEWHDRAHGKTETEKKDQ